MDINGKIICQSCAMPMKKQEDFGINRDRSQSSEYCKFCFQNGKFVDEGISIGEKINNLVDIGTNKLGMSEEQARTMAETQLPQLKRWKKSENYLNK